MAADLHARNGVQSARQVLLREMGPRFIELLEDFDVKNKETVACALDAKFVQSIDMEAHSDVAEHTSFAHIMSCSVYYAMCANVDHTANFRNAQWLLSHAFETGYCMEHEHFIDLCAPDRCGTMNPSYLSIVPVWISKQCAQSIKNFFIAVVEAGKLKLLQHIVDIGYGVHTLVRDTVCGELTLLSVAARTGNVAMCAFIYEYRKRMCRANMKLTVYESPSADALCIAITQKHCALVVKLIEIGYTHYLCNHARACRDRRNYLEAAILSGDIDVAKAVLDAAHSPAFFNTCNDGMQSFVKVACDTHRDAQLTKLLFDTGLCWTKDNVNYLVRSAQCIHIVYEYMSRADIEQEEKCRVAELVRAACTDNGKWMVLLRTCSKLAGTAEAQRVSCACVVKFLKDVVAGACQYAAQSNHLTRDDAGMTMFHVFVEASLLLVKHGQDAVGVWVRGQTHSDVVALHEHGLDAKNFVYMHEDGSTQVVRDPAFRQSGFTEPPHMLVTPNVLVRITSGHVRGTLDLKFLLSRLLAIMDSEEGSRWIPNFGQAIMFIAIASPFCRDEHVMQNVIEPLCALRQKYGIRNAVFTALPLEFCSTQCTVLQLAAYKAFPLCCRAIIDMMNANQELCGVAPSALVSSRVNAFVFMGMHEVLFDLHWNSNGMNEKDMMDTITCLLQGVGTASLNTFNAMQAVLRLLTFMLENGFREAAAMLMSLDALNMTSFTTDTLSQRAYHIAEAIMRDDVPALMNSVFETSNGMFEIARSRVWCFATQAVVMQRTKLIRYFVDRFPHLCTLMLETALSRSRPDTVSYIMRTVGVELLDHNTLKRALHSIAVERQQCDTSRVAVNAWNGVAQAVVVNPHIFIQIERSVYSEAICEWILQTTDMWQVEAAVSMVYALYTDNTLKLKSLQRYCTTRINKHCASLYGTSPFNADLFETFVLFSGMDVHTANQALHSGLARVNFALGTDVQSVRDTCAKAIQRACYIRDAMDVCTRGASKRAALVKRSDSHTQMTRLHMLPWFIWRTVVRFYVGASDVWHVRMS